LLVLRGAVKNKSLLQISGEFERDHIMQRKTDFTQHEDVLLQILQRWDASLDSMAALLRLRLTCTKAKGMVDTILEPGQKAIPQWLAMLHARASAITNNENYGGTATKQPPLVAARNLRCVKMTEVFRTLQENYFFDERVVGMIFCNMHTVVDEIILAIEASITHNFHEAIRLLGDVCIRAMRCHITNRDIILHGCDILADAQSHASLDCAQISQQLPMLTDALYHHKSDLKTVSALLRFIYRINKTHQFFRYQSISGCSAEKCHKFSAALADVMQCHMHSNAWINIQAGVSLHYTRKACVNVACDIFAQVWNIIHDEYYWSVGFADSVNALANAVRLHRGRTVLKSASNAVRTLLKRLSVGCPEIQKSVKHMLLASGLMKPTKHKKNDMTSLR